MNALLLISSLCNLIRPRFVFIHDAYKGSLLRAWLILEKLGCPNEKNRLNYTGIPIPTKHIDMNFSGFGKDKPLKILQVSRFIEKKGLDITIKAFKKILDLGFNARLILVGDGPLKPKLIKMSINLEIKSKVEFKGFLNQEEIE